MPEATTFEITDGIVAFALVDTAAVDYEDSWQAPGGETVDTVTLADYGVGAAMWRCQVTSGQLVPSADTTTRQRPATFCQPGETIPSPGVTSYALAIEFLQDPNVKAGLQRFLFEHDVKEAYFLLGLNSEDPPKAIGRVRLASGAFGGAAREELTASLSLPLTRKPQIEFGTAADSAIVPPNPTP